MQITISKESNPKENNSLKISVSWNNDILAYTQLNPTKNKNQKKSYCFHSFPQISREPNKRPTYKERKLKRISS